MGKLLLSFFVASVIITGCELSESTSSNEGIENYNESGATYNVTATNFIEDADYIIDHYSEGSLALTDEGKGFIYSNLDFFLDQSDSSVEKAKSMVKQIDLKELNKNATPFLTTFTSFSGYVLQIEEFDYGDIQVTHALIEDYSEYESNYNYFTVIMFGSAENIFDEDHVTFYGLPVGKYGFDNIGGGTTISQMFLGSSIEKSN